MLDAAADGEQLTEPHSGGSHRLAVSAALHGMAVG